MILIHYRTEALIIECLKISGMAVDLETQVFGSLNSPASTTATKIKKSRKTRSHCRIKIHVSIALLDVDMLSKKRLIIKTTQRNKN